MSNRFHGMLYYQSVRKKGIMLVYTACLMPTGKGQKCEWLMFEKYINTKPQYRPQTTRIVLILATTHRAFF